MNFKELKSQVKDLQKQLAIDIRRGKFIRKQANWSQMTDNERKTYLYKTTGSYGITEKFMSWKVDGLGVEYRSWHIAYCTFFNKTPYEKIERPRKDNKPNTIFIQSLIKGWEKQLNEEVIRCCAA